MSARILVRRRRMPSGEGSVGKEGSLDEIDSFNGLNKNTSTRTSGSNRRPVNVKGG